MDRLETARKNLLDKIWEEQGWDEPEVYQAMINVPRHFFVDSAFSDQAYQDNALPIGHGQTISQPTIVAMMTKALLPLKGQKVLEIGTGSGYQTAILAQFTQKLYTVERQPQIAQKARERFTRLGLSNITAKTGDGSSGWAAWAPYDRILVAAGAPIIPEELKSQLNEQGKLIIPTGDRESQTLFSIERNENQFITKDLGKCRFVPLLGKSGW